MTSTGPASPNTSTGCTPAMNGTSTTRLTCHDHDNPPPKVSSPGSCPSCNLFRHLGDLFRHSGSLFRQVVNTAASQGCGQASQEVATFTSCLLAPQKAGHTSWGLAMLCKNLLDKYTLCQAQHMWQLLVVPVVVRSARQAKVQAAVNS